MKLILQREVAVMHWRVVATLGFTQKRPEITAILALAEELPDGIITGLDVSRKLLAERPALVGERLLRVCHMMQLIEPAEPPREGWRLTELGQRALKNQEVPTPQRGEFDVWAMDDSLHPEIILRVRPTELERPPKPGEQRESAILPATQEIPTLLRRCESRIVRPPARAENEASEVFVFEFAGQCRCMERERGQLSVELQSDGGFAKFTLQIEGRQTSFAPAAKLPSLSEALAQASRSDAAGPQKVTFRTLGDNERRQARRETDLEELDLSGMGSFTSARLREVPLVPATQADANEWAVWRLRDRIRNYVWPQEFEKLVRDVREFAVREKWEFDATLPSQHELAERWSNEPSLARKLSLPMDWQSLGQPDSPTVFILSGRAAHAQEARKLLREWSDGAARIFILESADANKAADGVAGELKERSVARRVRQAPDLWLRISADNKLGQRWQPAPKPDAKSEKSKGPETPAKAGEWRDLSETEFGRLIEEVRTAFWKQATQELQIDGTWVAVKPS